MLALALALLALFCAVKDPSATYARGYQGQARGVWHLPRAYTFFRMHAHHVRIFLLFIVRNHVHACMGVFQQRGLWVVCIIALPRNTRLNAACLPICTNKHCSQRMTCLHATLLISYICVSTAGELVSSSCFSCCVALPWSFRFSFCLLLFTVVVRITWLVLMKSNTCFDNTVSCSSVVVGQYVIEEVMNEGLQTALATYNLVGAEGDGSEADIKNDIEDMLKVRNRKD